MTPKPQNENENTITPLLDPFLNSIPRLSNTKDGEKLRNTAWEILHKLPPEIQKRISQNPETAMAIAKIVLGVAVMGMWFYGLRGGCLSTAV
jgi:hypothetical protein